MFEYLSIYTMFEYLGIYTMFVYVRVIYVSPKNTPSSIVTKKCPKP